MSDKIIGLPNIEREKLIADIEEMKRIMPHLLELSTLSAQIKYSQYQAFIESGFTQEQSLFLIAK